MTESNRKPQQEIYDGFFPPHFLNATFPKIGGKEEAFYIQGIEYKGLLLPGKTPTSCTVAITSGIRNLKLSELIQKKFASAVYSDVTVYDYQERRDENFTGEVFNEIEGITYARPNKKQAGEAQQLQKDVWGSENSALYPAFLYHPESGAATQLVALQEGKVVGFLLGFYGQEVKNGVGINTWIESQIMAVAREQRGNHIAERLKFLQREQALAQGITCVQWTVDPLQWPNPLLNFNILGAQGTGFYQNHYAFRNDINKVPASRLRITWQLDSQQVIDRASGKKEEINPALLFEDKTVEKIVPVVGSNIFDSEFWNPEAQKILIEIPSDWNTMQKQDENSALNWRTSTDAVFTKLFSTARYVLSAAMEYKGKKYLMAERMTKS